MHTAFSQLHNQEAKEEPRKLIFTAAGLASSKCSIYIQPAVTPADRCQNILLFLNKCTAARQAFLSDLTALQVSPPIAAQAKYLDFSQRFYAATTKASPEQLQQKQSKKKNSSSPEESRKVSENLSKNFQLL